ncbi:MAG: FecR domain-containing protein [Desulfobacterales bacterium]|nr:FecR domain-containing protein [Desulfobacterales bacterium]
MSAYKKLWIIVAILIVCLVAGPAAGIAKAASQPIAKLTEFTGDLIVRSQRAWGKTPQIGMSLFSDDQIATREGEATVVFDDGSVLNIGRNTNAIIEQIEEKKGVEKKVSFFKRRFVLLLGKLGFKTGSLGSNTNLSTPTAVCGLRGTAGTLSLAEDGTPMITFTEGGRSFTLGELIDGVAEDVPTETASYNPLQWASFATNAVAAVAIQAGAQAAAAPADSPEAAGAQALANYWAARAALDTANLVKLISKTLADNNPDPTVVEKYTAQLAAADAAALLAQEAVARTIEELERLEIPIPEDPAPFILGPTFDVDPEPSLEDMTASPA